MSAIVDFRNGRYQGQVRNKKPHGVGVFFGSDLTLTFAHWREGRLEGKTIILYSDGTVFCGSVSNGQPTSTCYYQLQKEKIKVFFDGEARENSKFAAVIPNFNIIFQLHRSTLEIVEKHPYNKNDQQSNNKIIEKVTGKQLNVIGQQNESFLCFFEEHFCNEYPELFEHLMLGYSGAIQYSIGFRLQGLGAKIRPLGLEQLNGTTYKICEMGVMTKQNVLCGIGMKLSNTILNKMKVQEGVFSLAHTLTNYQYDDDKRDKNRPTKCLVTFLNYLKRSLHYSDKYLHQKQIKMFKEEIDKISEVTFVEMKVKKAHQIIQTPLNNQEVFADIERKRRQKKEESNMFQRGQFTTKLTPNIFNNGQIPPVSSSFNLNSLKQDLERSISKKKTNKSITKETKDNYVTPKKDSLNKSHDKRLNGSITPPHRQEKINQTEQKKFGVLINKTRKNSKNSPIKYQSDKIQKAEKEWEVRDQIKKIPAPILKKSIETVPKTAKVSFRQKQLQEWEKSKLKLQKTASSPKKYSDFHRKTKASSPGKAYNKPILTQNIFD